MAQYNADILLNVKYNERSLDRVAATVSRVQSLAKQIKPINLLRPGAGAGADQVAIAMDEILKRAKAINKEGVTQVSATYAGAAQTADAFAEVLSNVNITVKNGNVELSNQSAEVKELAGAYATAAAKSETLQNRFESLIAAARQSRGLAIGPASVLGTVEADSARATAAAQTKYQEQLNKNTRTDLLYQRLKLELLNKQADELLKQDTLLTRILKKTSQFSGGVGGFGENLALGVGFPLLFGGGAGSIAGSAIGSFFGKGFGGQILGGALGQILDQALIKIRDIGNAIKGLNFDVLTDSGIRFTAEVQSQLDLLLQVGDALTAQKIVSQEVARETGTLPGVTEDVANSVNILNDSWRKTINAVSTTVGIIAAPFAVALAAILELVNAIFRAVNTIFSLIGTGIKTAAEFVIQLIGGKDAVDFINSGIDRLNSGLSEATAKAAEFRSTINQAVVQSDIELRAARGLTPGVTAEEKITNINIQLQKELNLLAQEEADERVKIRQENVKNSAEIVASLLQQNTILFKNKKETIEINAQRQVTTEIQRNQADLDRKAAQELERQRKELERMAKLRMDQLDTAQRNFVLAEADIGVLTAIGDEGKAQAEFEKVRVERMFTFSELLKKALSDEERAALTQTQYLKALAAQIDLDNTILDIQKKQTTELYNQLDVAGILSAKRQAGFARAAGLENTQFNPNLNLFAISEKDQALERTRLELEKLLDPITQVTVAAEGIGSAFATSFTGIVSGTMTAQEALAGFFQNIADQFLDMAAQIIAKWIQMTILNSVLKLFPGPATGGAASGGFTLPGGAGFADGFSLPSLIPGRAAGGSVSAGSPYIVGERGPELFVPGRSGTIVPNGEMGGNKVEVGQINISVENTGDSLSPQAQKQIAGQVRGIVLATLVDQQRSGGILR